MSKNRERELLHELDKLAFVASGATILILVFIYLLVATTTGIVPEVREFVLGITVNLIPIFLIFAISYALFRRIQTIKSEQEVDEFTEKIVSALREELDRGTTKIGDTKRAVADLLLQNTETKVIHIVDRNGLRHPINDEDTAHYFMDVLGYQLDELPQVEPTSLRPLGPEVTALRKWKRPYTIEDHMSFDARSSLKLIRKRVRTEEGIKVLSFYLRNNSEYKMQIHSAKLFLNIDAPIAGSDISAKNSPSIPGLITCKLLFNGESGSRELSSQEESRLDLFLTRNLTDDESSIIETVHLGYVDITGSYRDTSVNFHIQC